MPTSASFQNSLSFLFFSSSDIAFIEPIILLGLNPHSISLNLTNLFLYSCKFSFLVIPDKDIGINMLYPSFFIMNPFSVISDIVPSRISSFLNFSSNSFWASFILYFLLESSTFPSPSFIFITSAIILSPILSSSLGFAFSLYEYSLFGINPSAL